jgi:hypothetical protein
MNRISRFSQMDNEDFDNTSVNHHQIAVSVLSEEQKDEFSIDFEKTGNFVEPPPVQAFDGDISEIVDNGGIFRSNDNSAFGGSRLDQSEYSESRLN